MSGKCEMEEDEERISEGGVCVLKAVYDVTGIESVGRLISLRISSTG